jgi:hypothetical protein
MRDAAVAACLLALAAAGCGSSGVDRVADRRWARAIVLQRSDLPAFDPQPPQGKGCLPGHLEAQTAFARSQRFDSLGQSAAGRAWIFRGESEARSAFRALVRRDYASCLRKPAVGPRVLAARQEAFGPRTGDRFRGLRIAVRLAQGGAPRKRLRRPRLRQARPHRRGHRLHLGGSAVRQRGRIGDPTEDDRPDGEAAYP